MSQKINIKVKVDFSWESDIIEQNVSTLMSAVPQVINCNCEPGLCLPGLSAVVLSPTSAYCLLVHRNLPIRRIY